MVICPLQNKATFNLNWIQVRPVISQKFGANPDKYKKFGLAAHAGLDYIIPVGTPIFAPMDGYITIASDPSGYGLHILLRNPFKKAEVVLAHLSLVNEKLISQQDKFIYEGDLVAWSGATGYSFGGVNNQPVPHLHYGFRKLVEKPKLDLWQWPVRNQDNGYDGFIDPTEVTITWKGSLAKTDL